MALDRMVALYLRDAENDLDLVRRCLVPPVNRLAAFHLQQAAEKIVKAVRVARRLPATAAHDLASLVDELGPADPLRPALAPLDDLTPYATAYRYPTPKGLPSPGLSPGELSGWADRLARLALDVRAALEHG